MPLGPRKWRNDSGRRVAGQHRRGRRRSNLDFQASIPNQFCDFSALHRRVPDPLVKRP